MLKKLFKINFISLILISCFNSIGIILSVERGLYSSIRPTIELEKLTDEEDKRIIKGETAIFEIRDAKEIISINNNSFGGKKNKIKNINKNQFTYEALYEGCDDLEIKYLDNVNREVKEYACIDIATEAEITFIIYLAGDNNLNGGSYTYSPSQDMVLKDLSEIQAAYIDKKALNILIYLDVTDKALEQYNINKNGIDSVGIYKIIDGKLALQKDLSGDDNYRKNINRSDKINTGRKESLTQCLNAGYNLSKSKKIILEIWGHGNSLGGIGFDEDEKSKGDSLSLKELKEGIEESKIDKIDILNFSACLMMSIEVFYELRDHVKYISGSPEFVPGDGSYYGSSKGILTWISKNYSAPLKDIATEISNLNFESYKKGGGQYLPNSEYKYFLSYSVVDITQMDQDFINNLRDLFNKLDVKQLEEIKGELLHYGKNVYPSKEMTEYIDFIDLINNLEDKKILTQEVKKIKDSLKNFIIFNRNFIPKYNGVSKSGFSIYYYPSYFGNRHNETSSFGKDTNWNKFLQLN